MKSNRLLLIVMTLLCSSGCSLLMPYEEDFACRLEDNYGKCISMEDAYKEAVTGESQGEYLRKSDYVEEDISDSETEKKENHSVKKQTDKEFITYRQNMYKELSELIEDPVTPMLKPPKTIRTLILPYSAKNEKVRLFMPRYVYSIVDDPRWVLGEYLYKKPELTNGILERGAQ